MTDAAEEVMTIRLTVGLEYAKVGQVGVANEVTPLGISPKLKS